MLNISEKIYYRSTSDDHVCVDEGWCKVAHGASVWFPIRTSVACVIQLEVRLCWFLWSGYTNWSEMAKLFHVSHHQLGFLDKTSLEQSVFVWYAKKKNSVLFNDPVSWTSSNSTLKKKRKKNKSCNAYWKHAYVSWRLFKNYFRTLLRSSLWICLMILCQKATLLRLNTREILRIINSEQTCLGGSSLTFEAVWEAKYQSSLDCTWVKALLPDPPFCAQAHTSSVLLPSPLACLLARIPLRKTFPQEIQRQTAEGTEWWQITSRRS